MWIQKIDLHLSSSIQRSTRWQHSSPIFLLASTTSGLPSPSSGATSSLHLQELALTWLQVFSSLESCLAHVSAFGFLCFSTWSQMTSSITRTWSSSFQPTCSSDVRLPLLATTDTCSAWLSCSWNHLKLTSQSFLVSLEASSQSSWRTDWSSTMILLLTSLEELLSSTTDKQWQQKEQTLLRSCRLLWLLSKPMKTYRPYTAFSQPPLTMDFQSSTLKTSVLESSPDDSSTSSSKRDTLRMVKIEFQLPR